MSRCKSIQLARWSSLCIGSFGVNLRFEDNADEECVSSPEGLDTMGGNR